MRDNAILTEAVVRLKKMLTADQPLLDLRISVKAVCLTPEEAIGNPTRRDYPIIEGKERVVEATVLHSKGQAFTDDPGEFTGTVQEIFDLDLSSNRHRAIVIAAMNALLGYRGLVEGTVHCRNEDPEKCSKEIASHILEKFGRVTVGLIGLNPAMLEALANTFGAERVRATDLNRKNIGTVKYGVEIGDGRERTEDMVRSSDILLITGTTLVNGTLDGILELVARYGKNYLLYGTTISGVARLRGLDRICPYARNG